jgi:ATP-dependent Zn protease
MMAKVDAEIRVILDRGYADAVKLIKSKKKEMDAVSLALLEKENMDQEEFEKLVGPKVTHA